jgi:hypothetical protein
VADALDIELELASLDIAYLDRLTERQGLNSIAEKRYFKTQYLLAHKAQKERLKMAQKGKTAGPPDPKREAEKRKSFVSLANKRVSKALKAVQLIGNLYNRSTYKYDDADVAKIAKALQDECQGVINRFKGKAEEKSAFAIGE